jgi:hypothetical protein
MSHDDSCAWILVCVFVCRDLGVSAKHVVLGLV